DRSGRSGSRAPWPRRRGSSSAPPRRGSRWSCGGTSGLGGEQGTDRLAGGNPADVVGGVQVEHEDRQVVLLAEGDCRRLQDPEPVTPDALGGPSVLEA